MKVLYIAYSCLPNKGSEEKIGWNISIESAKGNQVIVVTKEEHREVIEKYVKEHKINNPKFYFVDIPEIHKRVWKGVAYSVRLNIWHRKALPIVRQICKDEEVDIIHQITPIEFRSIGAYYKIPDVRFVCGPLGGGEYIPSGLKRYAISNMHIEFIRCMLNFFYKMKYSISRQLLQCDYFLFANYETQNYMRGLIGNVANELYSDIGISTDEILETKKVQNKTGNKLIFLTAGRMVYRKGHRLLLEVIKSLPEKVNCEFRFIGDGPEIKKLNRICKKYKLENQVVFVGRISYSEMKEEYDSADVFIMPSIRETTGSVLLEAASRGIPVITIDRFGAYVLFDDKSAYFYTGKTTSAYIDSLKNTILDCVKNSEKIQYKAENATHAVMFHTWDKKIEKYNIIYRELID